MGLDQYAIAVNKDGGTEEIYYWRKHNRLHGWMEQEWESDGEDFNGKKVWIDEDLLDRLESDVRLFRLPKTTGFFFGHDSYGDNGDGTHEAVITWRVKNDLQFIREARERLKNGDRVYYDSWW